MKEKLPLEGEKKKDIINVMFYTPEEKTLEI